MGPMETALWSRHGLVRTVFGRSLTAENRTEEMRWRRDLLSAHQIVGFTTFASMLATVYYGQKMYNSQDFTLRHTHRELAFLTIGTYTATALLALATPPPLVRRKQWSSISTHKTLAWVHLTGLVVTPTIGLMIKNSATPRRLEGFHLASAYLTTATFGASILVLTF
jgi:hypothetical protein